MNISSVALFDSFIKRCSWLFPTADSFVYTSLALELLRVATARQGKYCEFGLADVQPRNAPGLV